MNCFEKIGIEVGESFTEYSPGAQKRQYEPSTPDFHNVIRPKELLKKTPEKTKTPVEEEQVVKIDEDVEKPGDQTIDKKQSTDQKTDEGKIAKKSDQTTDEKEPETKPKTQTKIDEEKTEDSIEETPTIKKEFDAAEKTDAKKIEKEESIIGSENTEKHVPGFVPQEEAKEVSFSQGTLPKTKDSPLYMVTLFLFFFLTLVSFLCRCFGIKLIFWTPNFYF